MLAITVPSADPDLDYNQRIRPWKSRLGLLYVKKKSVKLDVKLLYLTALAILSRDAFLSFVRNNPDVALEMLSALTDRLRRTDDSFQNLYNRIANDILAFRQKNMESEDLVNIRTSPF